MELKSEHEIIEILKSIRAEVKIGTNILFGINILAIVLFLLTLR